VSIPKPSISSPPVDDDIVDSVFENYEKIKKGSLAKPKGRPPHKPDDRTRQIVMTARGMGMEQNKIALLLDINEKTLRKFYRRELDTGVERANLSVATALHKRATSGKDTIASIFWMKARAGWVDTVRNVHEGLPEKITVSFAMPALEDKSAMIDVTPEPDKE
jgi:hypothetical protein